MTLHDFIILMTLPIGGTSGYNEIQYKIYKWIHSEVTNTSTIWIKKQTWTQGTNILCTKEDKTK